MSWRTSLGFALLVLTAAGCGAAGRASLPVESAPDTASIAAANAPTADAAGAALPGSDVTVLKAIRLASGHTAEGGVRVEIEATSPINYTSYEPNPSKFILEIPNVDVTALPRELAIGEAGIQGASITPLPSHHSGTHARIEFTSASAMHARVVPEGTLLSVLLDPVGLPGETVLADALSEETVPAKTAEADLTNAPAVPAAGQPAIVLARPESASPQAAALPRAAKAGASHSTEPATLVSGVVVEGLGPAASVAIVGDGDLEHSEFVLTHPDRLVVDIAGVVNRVSEKSFEVSADPLQRVRVAQFRTQPRKVVRVVFDLTRPTAHRVVSDSDGLRVLLGEAALSPEEAPIVEEKPPVAAPVAIVAAAPVSTAPAHAASTSRDLVAAAAPHVPAEPPAARAAETIPPLPELAPRLVPSSVSDIGKDIVLFDRADPGQEIKSEPSVGVPPGVTFQSQTIAGEKRRYRGEKISVTFRDADIREVFFFFADVMKMNVVLDPDVTGKIDIRLSQVPWDQAFQVILKNQGLDAVEEDSVVRIAKTQKLRAEASERRALKQAQEQEVDPITFTRQLSYAKVQEALLILQQVKSDRGKLVADTRTNTLVISDIPDRRPAYENLLKALDTQTPQVSIEARIVEAIRNFERDLGIDWNFTGLADPTLGTQTNLQFPHRADFKADVNLGSSTKAGTLGIALGNVLDSVTLDVTLDAFEADGKVRILSSPRVVTQNNQLATIEQGVQIPVVTTTATEINVTYVPASLRLLVTPQITAEQTVIMKITVENNQPSSTVSVGDTPGIVTERVDTQILVRSGTTTVIGGVYKLQETNNETGIPGLRRIPFFGWLFKNKSYKKDSSELIVFLTPKIVTNV